MGCDESSEDKNQKPILAVDVFNELKLQNLLTEGQQTWNNDFEKDIFMAINVLRNESVVFTSVVEDVKANNPKMKDMKHTDKLLKYLEMNEQLGSIHYDLAAMDAARKNNEEKCAMQFQQAPWGGNIVMLEKLLGGIKVVAEEVTFSNYPGTSGMGLVAQQLICDFDKNCESILLKPDTTRVGISIMPCASCTNLIQLLYVAMPM
jgi:hypothetical protein